MKKLKWAVACATLVLWCASPSFAAEKKKADWLADLPSSPAYKQTAGWAASAGKMVGIYFYYDYDQKKIVDGLTAILEARKKDALGKNAWYAFLGVVFLLAALFWGLIFAFKLLMKSFDAGLVWGFAYLSILAVSSAPVAARLGQWAVPLAWVAYPLFWLYVFLYWEAARKPVVCQLFALGSLMIGIVFLGLA